MQDHGWKVGPTPRGGSPKIRMYHGYTPTWYGAVYRRVGGRLEMTRCCQNGHIKKARALACGAGRARRLERGEEDVYWHDA